MTCVHVSSWIVPYWVFREKTRRPTKLVAIVHVCHQCPALTRMCAPLLQQFFQSVVISKLTYAAPVWWGFSTSVDRQRVETFFVELLVLVCGSLRRLPRNLLTMLMNDCFLKFGTVLTTFLKNCCQPHLTQQNRRKRRHNLALPQKKGHLAAKNFIIRLLYKDTY